MSRSRPLRGALLSVLLLLGGARGADAQIVEFLGGGLTGLAVHESGHIVTGLALGADPGFKRLDYGFIPFFAVTHEPVSRGREFIISASGFLAQHGANEWLLSGGGLQRTRSSAFRKGWLTFNLGDVGGLYGRGVRPHRTAGA